MRRRGSLEAVSQLFGLEQLEAAVAMLSGTGSLRRRLGYAWAEHLARIDPEKDLPGEVRQRFRASPMFGRRASALPEGMAIALNLAEMQAACAEVVAIRDRVRSRLGR
jgi:hypothetical protein